jgi:hypothetical protein
MQNRKLIFAKNLSLPLGEKMFYNPLNGYIHLPVFRGSNYSNKENMYFFWFQDESVLTETNLSGTTTSNTFFMTAKFYNAKEGTILDFANDCYSTGHTITEQNDMYYQVDIDKRDYSYKVYYYNGVVKCEEVGLTNKPITFFERGGGTCPSNLFIHTCSNITPTPTPSITPTKTPTPTPTHTPTPTPSGGGTGSVWTVGNQGCGLGSINDVGINSSFMNTLEGPSTFPLSSGLYGVKTNPGGINYGGTNTIQCNLSTSPIAGPGNCAAIFVYKNGALTPDYSYYFESNPFPQITGVVINGGDTVRVSVECFALPCPY